MGDGADGGDFFLGVVCAATVVGGVLDADNGGVGEVGVVDLDDGVGDVFGGYLSEGSVEEAGEEASDDGHVAAFVSVGV